ncbi:MAG: metal-dependent transcriptional regulator [Oscillospiraceae bacterium]|nr:metal-dependent transcriptional regulator [Oscillospiraceae bacterium]
MKIKESAENYLEAILTLNRERPDVHAIDIATYLDFSKPSVSIAMKKLREAGYILVDEHGHITLTETGAEIAERVYERHTFLSQWLRSIDVPPEIAAEDACRMEHILSNESFEAIRRFVSQHK